MALTNLRQATLASLLKIAAVVWLIPIYVGAAMCACWLIIKLNQMLGWWVLGQSFENTVLYSSTVYYGAVLSYLAITNRVWVPNGFVRISVQYLFKLPKALKKTPAFMLSIFPAYAYLFLPIALMINAFYSKNFFPSLGNDAAPHLSIIMLTSILASYCISLVITHQILKRVHFVKVHLLHDLSEKK